ncbi:hypothetical protein [Paenibacillus cucumis (ex Kampfer et al. 2016)]|uniref:ATPase AAA-type core domain-containing protein n=1 Tax=Paenibacillus cucumis (ex Kampfer et al. 2016) TaxID=1776858 RepID=A0ABS7KSJ1_9BACL|nr:hypothetical protein [Paenibacillus cucumis (ex Kampfer et al. 2016)]MBY0207059.1 hypothetical protein [Paenibacillus cucumis (ex Kampfer et al. 2016)]
MFLSSLAAVHALDPPLLLMDEPFSALDEFTKEKLQMELLEIKRSTGKTFLFVTHSIPIASPKQSFYRTASSYSLPIRAKCIRSIP